MSKAVEFKIKIKAEGGGVLQNLIIEASNAEEAIDKIVESASRASDGIKRMAEAGMAFTTLNRAISEINGMVQGLAAPFNSFEESMAKVNTMAGKNADGLKILTDQIQGISEVVPLAREALAEGLYQTISAGVPEAQWLDYLDASARSAVGGCADLGGVVKVTSGIIKAYGADWADAGAIQNKIQQTAKLGVTSFEELSQALPRVTGNAATLGVQVNELMAVFATATNVTGNTAEVSTQLAAVLNSLVKPSSEATKAAQAMGISFDAASVRAAGGLQNFLLGVDAAVQEYAASTGTLSETIYGQLFGSAEALRLLGSLTGEQRQTFATNIEAMADSAVRLLGDLQAELEFNQRLIADFGEQKNLGSWLEGEFKTRAGVKCLAIGRGQSPRGLRDSEARPDYIIIDDIDDDEMCKNESRVKACTEWVKEALFGALDVGRGRFIIVGNLISKKSVLANFCKSKGVKVSEIKAVDGEGNPVWKDKWTREEAQEYKDFVGYRAWEKEMMHNPITDGTIFRHDWIRYKECLPLGQYDMLVCYTDPSFKSSTSNDYKACRLWGKKGTELHLIDTYVRQDTVSGMVRWLYDLYERLPEDCAVTFYMEANFMQDTILDEFDAEGEIRGHQLPIMADKRVKPDKIQRIEAVSPLWERGKVFYNAALKESPDMEVGIEQTLSLERGSRVHDDAPDADEGAIWYLQRSGRQEKFEPVIVQRSHRRRSAW